MNGVHGSLVTLAEIINEVTDIQMPQVAPAILPQVYKIFVDPQHYSLELRRRAIEIFTAIVNVIAEMAEYDASCGKKYLFPCLAEFTFAMVNVLGLSVVSGGSTVESSGGGGGGGGKLVDNGLKSEVIKALSALLKSFPKKLTTMMNDVLTQIWNCLVQSSQVNNKEYYFD